MTLRAYYKLKGDANDSSGNGYNGTPNNMTYIEGKFGQCASFNGTSSRITASASAMDFAIGNRTVMLWFKTAGQTGTRDILVGSRTDTPSRGFRIGVDNTLGVLATVSNGVTQFLIYDPSDITSYKNSKWHWLAFTLNSTTKDANLYYDDKLIKTMMFTDENQTVNITTIGAFTNSGGISEYFNGQVSEIKTYSDCFTKADMKNAYSAYVGFF